MPVTLPTSPSLGQTLTTNNDVYYWDGSKWVDVSNNTRTTVYLEASASGTFTSGVGINFSTVDSTSTIQSWISTASGEWRLVAPYNVVLNCTLKVGGSGGTPINIQMFKISTSGVATSKDYMIDTHSGAFDVSTGAKNISLLAGEAITFRSDSTSAGGMNAYLTVTSTSQITASSTSSSSSFGSSNLVGCKVFGPSSGSVSAGAVNPITFTTLTNPTNSADVGYDTNSAYNLTNGTFTCPVTGVYQFCGHVRFNDIGSQAWLIETIIQKNISGTWTVINYACENDRTSTRPSVSFTSAPMRMVAAEQFRLSLYTSIAFNWFSPSRSWMSITRLGGY